MKIYLSGHYSNDFLKEIVISKCVSTLLQVGAEKELESFMKVCLVNISTTSGGVISDCISSIYNNKPLKELNKEAMNVFLAGMLSCGNLRDFNQKLKDIEPHSADKIIEAMKVYIAGDNNKKRILRQTLFSSDAFFMGENALANINVLESYYYLRKNEDFMTIVRHFGSFLLDSGAFTFMSGSHKGVIDWDKYVEDYAAFINRYDIKLFFELDIDSVVGIAEVERLRFKLEKLTGKKPIPVWHKNRGKEYFINMCENYPYVALGGIVTKEIPRSLYEKGFPWFIKTAHDHGCKIHGLGYTTVANLKKYHFDSVDSTAWLYGNRGGYLYKFNPRTGLMEQIDAPKNSRLKSRAGAVNNFNEWVKFSAYADKYL